MPPTGRVIPLIGLRFGALVPIARAGSQRRYAMWLCACDCGQQVTVRSDHLLYGVKKACQINNHRWRVPKPPGVTTKYRSEFKSWEHMRRRCNDPKEKTYANYGGRGIKVCARWGKFANFIADMGPKPSPKHTIDRKNNNGNYTPKNCWWATPRQQSRNTRRSVFVRYEGKRVLLCDLVEQLGLNRQMVYGRLKIGWSLKDALSLPVRKKVKKSLDTL